MHVIKNFITFNNVIVIVMTLLYLYQLVYILVGFGNRKKVPVYKAEKLHRYAVMISARNEEGVIAELIDSLKKQNYPAELLDLFVLADNCTDNTAGVSRAHGAFVYERFNRKEIGKGFALNELYHHIIRDHGTAVYDGFFVFDADNIVDPDFVARMNDMFDSGKFDALTSYRNSKNYAQSWLTAAYSIWFLREARFVNFPRLLLGNSCMISGTGFLVSAKLMRENHGWPFHLLTEDIQFSVDCALRRKKIGYCDGAMVYDEQPATFSQSWKQRLRWSKGFYQIDSRYIPHLVRKALSPKCKNRMSCYDVLMTVAPAMFLTLAVVLINVYMLFAAVNYSHYIQHALQYVASRYLILALINYYLGMVGIGLLTVCSEWKRIPCTAFNKIRYLWIFPLYIFSYIPIAVCALFGKVKWDPIRHYSSTQLQGKKS